MIRLAAFALLTTSNAGLANPHWAIPGIDAPAAAYGSWNCLPGKPVSVAEVPLAMRRRTLGWDQPRHPMVRALRKGGSVPPLTVRRSLVWEDLEEDAQTLISMGSGQPFLLDRAFGDGRVLFYAVSADRTWSDFPLSPFYLPMVVQSVDFSAGLGSKDPYYWAGDSLPLAGQLPPAPPHSPLVPGVSSVQVPSDPTT